MEDLHKGLATEQRFEQHLGDLLPLLSRLRRIKVLVHVLFSRYFDVLLFRRPRALLVFGMQASSEEKIDMEEEAGMSGAKFSLQAIR